MSTKPDPAEFKLVYQFYEEYIQALKQQRQILSVCNKQSMGISISASDESQQQLLPLQQRLENFKERSKELVNQCPWFANLRVDMLTKEFQVCQI